MSTSTPSIAHLQRALAVAEQIQKLEAELASILSGAVASQPANAATTPAKSVKKRGTMSSEGRAKIVAAQKARWAKIKAAKASPIGAEAEKKSGKRGKGKRRISPEGRAKMAAAAKKRWAEKKAKA